MKKPEIDKQKLQQKFSYTVVGSLIVGAFLWGGNATYRGFYPKSGQPRYDPQAEVTPIPTRTIDQLMAYYLSHLQSIDPILIWNSENLTKYTVPDGLQLLDYVTNADGTVSFLPTANLNIKNTSDIRGTDLMPFYSGPTVAVTADDGSTINVDEIVYGEQRAWAARPPFLPDKMEK